RGGVGHGRHLGEILAVSGQGLLEACALGLLFSQQVVDDMLATLMEPQPDGRHQRQRAEQQPAHQHIPVPRREQCVDSAREHDHQRVVGRRAARGDRVKGRDAVFCR
ncbi:hypothetical protein RZS08_10055, partial [Arthrospira platensis SPKY1]|nr:hypothetical protein [Arthrospira platensis SPKY1]